ncbi:MAG: hypothetical protein SGJ09_05970 [Phycisphaerae bacterium]|nr:hypothetical protein [Phycisphaerae bacterium]
MAALLAVCVICASIVLSKNMGSLLRALDFDSMRCATSILAIVTLCVSAVADDPKPNQRALAVMRDVKAALESTMSPDSRTMGSNGMVLAIWYPLVPQSSEFVARATSGLAASRSLPAIKLGELQATTAPMWEPTGVTWDGVVDHVIKFRRVELWNALRQRDYARAALAASTIARWASACGDPPFPSVNVEKPAREALQNALDLAVAQGRSTEEFALLHGAVISNTDREDPWAMVSGVEWSVERRARDLDARIRQALSQADVADLLGDGKHEENAPLDDATRDRLLLELAAWGDAERALLREAKDPAHRADAAKDAMNQAEADVVCETYRGFFTEAAERFNISSDLTAWRSTLGSWTPDQPLPAAPASLVSTLGWLDLADAVRLSDMENPKRAEQALPALVARLDALPPFVRHDFGHRTDVFLETRRGAMPLHWMAVQITELGGAIRTSALAPSDGKAAQRIASAADALLAFDLWGADVAASTLLERALLDDRIAGSLTDADLKQRYGALVERAIQRCADAPTAMRADLANRFARRARSAWQSMTPEVIAREKVDEMYRRHVAVLATWTESQLVTALGAMVVHDADLLGIDLIDGVMRGSSGYRIALDPPQKHPTMPSFDWRAIVGEQNTRGCSPPRTPTTPRFGMPTS